ncbi:MAG TPA: sensor histidine kinase [Acidimicrobiia bacterium]
MAAELTADVEHHARRRRALADGAVILVVGLVTIGATALTATHHDHRAIGVGGLVLLALAVLALPFRHRHPAGVLVVVLAASLAYWSFGYPRGPIFLPLLVAFFQAVLTGHRRVAITCLVVGFLGFPWLGYVIGRAPYPGWEEIVALGAWLVALLSITELVRSRRDRAREMARSRAEELRRRAGDERLQIARDLHDAVAHNMSLINIQASVALHLMDEQPGQAARALTTIKQASKEALVELRSILGVLRQVDEDAPRSATPSLDRLDDLVSSAEASGVEVTVDVDGALPELSRNTDLAAFRIIQESLTNVARHSDVPVAFVRIRTDGETLGLEILDEGSGRTGTPELPGGGNGIAGMRERAASVGGRLEAGPRPGRGFAVRAELPIGAVG